MKQKKIQDGRLKKHPLTHAKHFEGECTMV